MQSATEEPKAVTMPTTSAIETFLNEENKVMSDNDVTSLLKALGLPHESFKVIEPWLVVRVRDILLAKQRLSRLSSTDVPAFFYLLTLRLYTDHFFGIRLKQTVLNAIETVTLPSKQRWSNIDATMIPKYLELCSIVIQKTRTQIKDIIIVESKENQDIKERLERESSELWKYAPKGIVGLAGSVEATAAFELVIEKVFAEMLAAHEKKMKECAEVNAMYETIVECIDRNLEARAAMSFDT